MKKLLVILVLFAGLIYWFKGYVQSGGLEKFLDTHRNDSLNPAIEYYWGILLSLTDSKGSAVYRLSRVVSKYPKSSFAGDAWVECIEVIDDMGDRPRVVEEANRFMQSEYANNPRADIIKRKLAIIEHGF
jgi:hypothetical protein